MNSLLNLRKTFCVLVFFVVIPSTSFAKSLTVKSPIGTIAVVELYTSEGCSSCPPADEWISNYAAASKADDGVIALAFHVDYWNYLGWEDVFSKPEFTARQRHLGSLNKQRTIYTPEFFVNATETRRTHKIPKRVAKINKTPSAWDLTLTSSTANRSDKLVFVEFEGMSKTETKNTELYLAVYENDIVRNIGSGENRNKTLHHDFVVRHWIGPISFEESRSISHKHTIEMPVDSKIKNTGVAAILIDSKTGRTLQAVKSDLNTLFSGTSE